MRAVIEPTQREAEITSEAASRRLTRPAASTVVALALTLIAFIATAAVGVNVFDRLPHVEDELAFVFQAKAIASGHLLVAAPDRPTFFSAPFIIVRDGAWYGKYLPGYPMVLALGVLVGHVWIVNPLVGAACVWMLFVLGRRLYNAWTGVLAAALLLVSPFFLLQAGSLMSHVVSLAWTLVFLLCFEAARRRRDWRLACVGGLAMGMLLVTRPLTAIGIGLPFALWSLVDVVFDRKRLREYAAMALAFVPFIGMVLGYNKLTTGDPFKSAYQLWWPFDRIGFGDGIGITGHHSVGQGLHFTHMNLSMLATYLYGWPLKLSLAPVVLAVIVAATRLLWNAARWVRTRRGGSLSVPNVDTAQIRFAGWDLALAAMALSLITVHVAYPTPGQMYGPRYYFEAMPAFTLLSARGIMWLAVRLSDASRLLFRHDRRFAYAAASLPLVAVVVLSLYGATHFSRGQFQLYRDWNNVNDDGLRTVQAANLHNAVVFVTLTTWDQYAPYFVQDTPALDTNVIYAIDRGDDLNHLLAAEYPNRSAWRFTDGQLVRIGQP